MAITKQALEQIMLYYNAYGEEKTLSTFDISNTTFDRYKRKARQFGIEMPYDNSTIKKLLSRFSTTELEAIAEGGRFMPGAAKIPIVNFEGRHIRFGAITDTHIGHKCFSEDRLFKAYEEFKKEKVEFVTHSGDLTEGMSHRPGHVYELTHIGYDAQKEYAIKLLSQWTDTPIYGIDGNHDRWYIKSNGAQIVKDVAAVVENFSFIGHDDGFISLGGKANIELWHGEDGSSYALSYRLQKILESMSGGTKPNMIIAGHVHKYVNIFERNVYALSAGCIESQTQYMRSKRLSAHVGFNIVDLWINDTGISKMSHTWYPFYA